MHNIHQKINKELFWTQIQGFIDIIIVIKREIIKQLSISEQITWHWPPVLDSLSAIRMTNISFCVFVCLAHRQYSNFRCVGRPMSLPRVKGRLDLWPFCHRRGLKPASYTQSFVPGWSPYLVPRGQASFSLLLLLSTTFWPHRSHLYQKKFYSIEFSEFLASILQSWQSKYFEFPVTHDQSIRFFGQ